MDEIDEGCTPADARVLREANHALAAENDKLRQEINRFENRRGPLTRHEILLVATYAPDGVTNDEVAEIVAKVELMHGVVPNAQ